MLATEDPKKRRGLKAGVWYQVREKKDGSLVSYDANGTKLGSTPQARHGVLQLEEQGAGAAGYR